MRVFLFAVLTAVAAVRNAPAQAGDFDYFTLALSWSPTYCASENGRNDGHQCGPGRRFAFVVHGLWPQYERGWPEFCRSDRPHLPGALVDAMLDIMPSPRLVNHEWRKHGTCSGLGPADYFSVTRAAFARVKIPARYLSPQNVITTSVEGLTADFLKTNAWLRRDMMSVQCGNRRDQAALRELRICFTTDLEPRPCGDNERRQCRADELVMPPVR
jgi:ribonuclease T2